MLRLIFTGVLALSVAGCCSSWHQIPENPKYDSDEYRSAE